MIGAFPVGSAPVGGMVPAVIGASYDDALSLAAAAGYASAPTVAMTAALGLSGVAGATLAGGLSVSDSLTLTATGAYSGAVVMTFVPSVALSGAAGIVIPTPWKSVGSGTAPAVDSAGFFGFM